MLMRQPHLYLFGIWMTMKIGIMTIIIIQMTNIIIKMTIIIDKITEIEYSSIIGRRIYHGIKKQGKRIKGKI